jgi:quercetin dioxygenase-like cupin family protein
MANSSSSVQSIENAAVEGTLSVEKLLHGRRGLLLEIELTAGSTVPTHQHQHESFCYLLRGRLRLVIDGEERVVEPGDVWLHPEAVDHSTHALEDSVWLEFKSPPEAPFG